MIIYSILALPLVLTYLTVKNWDQFALWPLALSVAMGFLSYVAIFFIHIGFFYSPYDNLIKLSLYIYLIYFVLPSLALFILYRLFLKLKAISHNAINYPIFLIGFFTAYILPFSLFYNKTFGYFELFYLPTIYISLSHFYISFPSIKNKLSLFLRILLISAICSVPAVVYLLNYSLYALALALLIIILLEIIYLQKMFFVKKNIISNTNSPSNFN